MNRIVKKVIPVNHQFDLRETYIVDGWLHCPTKEKANEWVERYQNEI